MTDNFYILTLLDSHLSNPNPDQAHELIRYFHERLSASRDVDEQLDRDDAYLLEKLMMHAFEQILSGRTADQALGLKLGRGEYLREDTTDRDLALAAASVLRMRAGETWEDSTGNAAEMFDVSDTTARRAYEAYADGMRCFPDFALELLAGFNSHHK